MAKRIGKKNPDGSYTVEMTGKELGAAMASGQIKQGPIRHPNLPQEVLDVSKKIYHWVGQYSFPSTLERWETNLMREPNPIRELAVWVAIGLAADRLPCDHSQREDVVLRLVVASMGGANDAKKVYDDVCCELHGLTYEQVFEWVP